MPLVSPTHWDACAHTPISFQGNLRCEICGQDYKGNYAAPPPRPAPAAPQVLPVFIVNPHDPTRIAIRRGGEVRMLDDSLDQEYQRHPGLNFVCECG